MKLLLTRGNPRSMGLFYQFLVILIYQITNTLTLPIDPSVSLPSPHRTEHNLRMRLSIDPGIVQTSRPLTSFTIAPILSVEASTPSFAPESSSCNSPPLISPGYVDEHLPIIGSSTQYSKHASLDPLKVSLGLTSSFFKDLPNPILPGLSNDNTPTIPPIMYPGEIIEPLKPILGSVSPFYENLSTIPSLIIDNTPKVVPFMTLPIETSKPVLVPVILLDKSTLVNPSKLRLAGTTVPILENSSSVIPSSIHLTEENLPLTDNIPSGIHLTGKNLHFIENSPSLSTSDLQQAGIIVPVIDNNPLKSTSSLHLTERNLPFIDKSPSVSYSGLQPAGISVPIVDNNSLISLSSTQLTTKNLPFVDINPSVSPSGIQPVGLTVPRIDNSPLISPFGIHLTGTNLPFIDKNPFPNPSELQLAEINAPLIKSNPTVVPPRLKMSEVPKTQAIPNIPTSRSSTGPLSYVIPNIIEEPQMESHVNIPAPMLNINFQIEQLNVPPNLQKKLQPLQYDCFPMNNLEIVPIVSDNSPICDSDLNPFLDQLNLANKQMVDTKNILNTNNFVTVPYNGFSPVMRSNIHSDVTLKETTNSELLPEMLKTNNPVYLKCTDEHNLVNTAVNPNPKPETLLLQLNEHANKNMPLSDPQNPPETLLKVTSMEIAPGDQPRNPKASLNDKIRAVPKSSGRCLEDIRNPVLPTNRLDIPKNSVHSIGDLTPYISPYVAATTHSYVPNIVELNTLPYSEQSGKGLKTTRDDVINYIPENAVEETQFSNTPALIPSSNPYIFQNIAATAQNLDSFVGNTPVYLDILHNSNSEYINIGDSNNFVRSCPYTFPELETNKIDPVVKQTKPIMSFEPIIPSTNTNIPLPLENIYANPYSNNILKDDLATTTATTMPSLPIIPSNADTSSNVPLKTTNIPDFSKQNMPLMSSFPRSFSPLNTVPPFKLCTPFIKSPSFLPKPSLSKLSSRLLSTDLSCLSSLLENSNSFSIVDISKGKSMPSITSITINVIPIKEECNPEIIIVL